VKKLFSFLSLFLALIVSQVRASDILILETFDDRTVSPYQVRTQIGVEAEEQIDTSLLIHTPKLDAAFGIGEWAEFGFNYEILALIDSPSFDDNIGSGDLRIRLKAVPIKTNLGNLGFLVMTKIPTANHEDGLGSDETDLILKAILSTTVFNNLHLFPTLEWQFREIFSVNPHKMIFFSGESVLDIPSIRSVRQLSLRDCH
jgi:hypothetical protein